MGPGMCEVAELIFSHSFWGCRHFVGTNFCGFSTSCQIIRTQSSEAHSAQRPRDLAASQAVAMVSPCMMDFAKLCEQYLALLSTDSSSRLLASDSNTQCFLCGAEQKHNEEQPKKILCQSSVLRTHDFTTVGGRYDAPAALLHFWVGFRRFKKCVLPYFKKPNWTCTAPIGAHRGSVCW